MTPQEKAKELIDIFLGCLIKNQSYYIHDCSAENQAKECALIVVDEILKNCYEVMKPFWQEVKQEIELL